MTFALFWLSTQLLVATVPLEAASVATARHYPAQLAYQEKLDWFKLFEMDKVRCKKYIFPVKI